MNVQEIHIAPLSLTFQVENNERKLYIPKSHTKVEYPEQLKLITNTTDFFVPLTVKELDESFLFTFSIASKRKQWQEMKQLPMNEKLRALCNLQKLQKVFHSRITFFLHPDNIVFDENLMPEIIYRGADSLIEPLKITEEDMLKQYKCIAVALFSDTFSFDDLYQGSLEKTGKNEFERQLKSKNTIQELFAFLKENFETEQKKTDQLMAMFPRKHFNLYKQLTIWLSVLTVLVAGFLIYVTLYIIPYQDRLMEAQNEFLADDYGEVIRILHKENIEKLPYHAKYILAYSYIKSEKLSDREKATIMKNIDLKSDSDYLTYWIYNGLGDFDQSIDQAKYMDDPRLIMYGLIKKMEQVKNETNLTGSEKQEETKKLQDELNTYTDEYDLLDEEENAVENDPADKAESPARDKPEDKGQTTDSEKNTQKESDKEPEKKSKKESKADSKKKSKKESKKDTNTKDKKK